MTAVFVIIFVVVMMAAGFAAQRAIIQSRRKQWMAMRLSDEQRLAIGRDFGLYARLPGSIRNELEGLMHVFMREKFFEACGGLDEVTEHMKHVISAQACLLLVNRKHDFYRNLRSILLYPNAYTAKDEHGEESVRLGESWHSGSVVLAWESVKAAGRNDEDGHHVTLHEFAHQLDQVDGAADGVPELSGVGSYRAWSQAFSTAYKRFTRKIERGKRSSIDEYGATNPAEFFAVATETFYEKPKQLQEEYPEVYQQLASYYKVDPLDWC